MKASEVYESVSARLTSLCGRPTPPRRRPRTREQIEKLNLEIRSVEFVARTRAFTIMSSFPAVARLYTQKTGKPAPPPIPVKKPTMEELRKTGQNRASTSTSPATTSPKPSHARKKPPRRHARPFFAMKQSASASPISTPISKHAVLRPKTGPVPPISTPLPHVAITCASSAKATATSSTTPMPTPPCRRLSCS